MESSSSNQGDHSSWKSKKRSSWWNEADEAGDDVQRTEDGSSNSAVFHNRTQDSYYAHRMKHRKAFSAIPDRWEEYRPVGKRICGTRFICFKVPLKNSLCRKLPDRESWFTPVDLMRMTSMGKHRLGLVIDLTNTSRYYNPEEITYAGVEYGKIYCPGQIIPPVEVVQQFYDLIEAYEKKYEVDRNLLIGIHCTHGINRSGYLICRYMIEKLNYRAEGALQAFGTARGHPVERMEYINHLFEIDAAIMSRKQTAEIPPEIVLDDDEESDHGSASESNEANENLEAEKFGESCDVNIDKETMPMSSNLVTQAMTKVVAACIAEFVKKQTETNDREATDGVEFSDSSSPDTDSEDKEPVQ